MRVSRSVLQVVFSVVVFIFFTTAFSAFGWMLRDPVLQLTGYRMTVRTVISIAAAVAAVVVIKARKIYR